jgi:hypothetical protein
MKVLFAIATLLVLLAPVSAAPLILEDPITVTGGGEFGQHPASFVSGLMMGFGAELDGNWVSAQFIAGQFWESTNPLTGIYPGTYSTLENEMWRGIAQINDIVSEQFLFQLGDGLGWLALYDDDRNLLAYAPIFGYYHATFYETYKDPFEPDYFPGGLDGRFEIRSYPAVTPIPDTSVPEPAAWSLVCVACVIFALKGRSGCMEAGTLAPFCWQALKVATRTFSLFRN